MFKWWKLWSRGVASWNLVTLTWKKGNFLTLSYSLQSDRSLFSAPSILRSIHPTNYTPTSPSPIPRFPTLPILLRGQHHFTGCRLSVHKQKLSASPSYAKNRWPCLKKKGCCRGRVRGVCLLLPSWVLQNHQQTWPTCITPEIGLFRYPEESKAKRRGA